MAKYIYNKYNTSATTRWTWRKYNISTSYTAVVDRTYTDTASPSTWYTNYSINSSGSFVGGTRGSGSLDFSKSGYTISSSNAYHYATSTGKDRTVTIYKANPNYSRATYIGTVTSSSSTAYPTNGQSGGYWYDTRTSSTSYSQGSYIGQVTAEDGTYPVDGRSSDGYWYVRQGLANTAPQISGSDLDLGGKTSGFDVEYIVTDADGDSVTVSIFEDNIAKVTDSPRTLGVNNKYTVNLSNFTLGQHTIKIVAKDTSGASSERIYTFQKVNNVPVLSSELTSELGNKNTPFSIIYRVTDEDTDKVTIIETLNGVEIRKLTDPQLGSDITLTISKAQLENLELNAQNTLEIKADDGKGGISYLRFYFTRTNSPPVISGTNSDLGNKTDKFSINYSVSDVEKDEINVAIFIDEKVVKASEQVVDSQEYTFEITRDMFIRLSKGKHTIRIEATDSKDSKSNREYTFTRIIDRIEVIFNIKETDELVTKVLATPIYKLFENVVESDVIEIFATNNGLDNAPVWEDITEITLLGRTANLLNDTKTATKGYVKVRVIIKTRGELTGLGGAIS